MKSRNKFLSRTLRVFVKQSIFAGLSGFAMILILAGTSAAVPDYYIGDSAIYGGPVTVRPNVLFLIDNSAGMSQSGVLEPYDPAAVYSGSYTKEAIYERKSATGGVINYVEYISSISSVTCGDALTALSLDTGGPGAYYGPLKKNDGSCDAAQSGNYYIGNFLNYLAQDTPTPPAWEASKVYAVGDQILENVGGSSYLYICTTEGTSNTSEPTWPTSSGSTVTDNTVVWALSPDDLAEMVETAVSQVVEAANESIYAGLMFFGENNHGGEIIQPVQDISADTTTLTTEIAKLSDSLLSANAQRVNEALWDAGLYYRGDNDSTDKLSSDNATYSSPAQASCQKNFIILVTTGNSADTERTKQKLTDLNEDGTVGDAVDAAMYNLQQDPSVETKVVQLMSAKVPLLVETAEKGHEGDTDVSEYGYYNVWNAPALTQALHDALVNILIETDTSFVAPVVPASPENRTYSGQRIYLGFFKPMNDEPWYGNLKKFGLSSDNQIVAYDSSGDLVPATDSSGYFLVNESTDPPTPLNRSFWTPSGTLDGGLVDSGGVGGLLKSRSSARSIYTYLGSESNLYNSANAFTTGNTGLTAAMLGKTDDTAKEEVINFVHGYESDGSTKRTWVLGDILHSKPLIINYANYSFSEANEADGTKNKSMIFFGANDGMMHAINDYNGQEAWAFIPPELLDDLHYMMDPDDHYYYVDASPLAYVHDADGDGVIESGDKVVLIFGLRRGGGSSTLATGSRGSFYAIDITTPDQPTLLWQINNQTSGFSELGETWSQPRLAKMNIGGVRKVVAVFGAGYDNNEDLRFGNTQEFPATDASTNTSAASTGFISSVSNGGGAQYLPKGRGLYVVEVASLSDADSDGAYEPSLTNSGSKIWSATYDASDTSNDLQYMTFSIPSDVLVFDKDHDGYYDRFYVGDTGGQLWRFTVGNSDPNAWTVKRIFVANDPSTTDVGRKIFYKPTITYSYPDTFIYFGTGDREHPLNYLNAGDPAGLVDPGDPAGATLDRFYMVRDRENDDNPNAPTYLRESNLVDLTTNQLQRDDTSAATVSTLLTRLFDFEPTDAGWNDRYGWYIKMNAHDGEKILAPPTVFADVAFFTTYTPDPYDAAGDPCSNDNLGTSRLYAVNARTGEAVYNWWSSEGTDEFGESQASASSQRAQAGTDDGAYVLRRADRSLAVGEGIPSGLVTVIGKDGKTSILIGSGGAFPNVDLDQIETVYPLYWMTW